MVDLRGLGQIESGLGKGRRMRSLSTDVPSTVGISLLCERERCDVRNAIDKAIARFSDEAYSKDTTLREKNKELGGLCATSEGWEEFLRSRWDSLGPDLGWFGGSLLVLGYTLRDMEVRIETPNSNTREQDS
ncbi:hypothetical protein LCGC14_2240890 [marine sediment metagenome]|uniref:Uncharacterized protein n=1 Tax=marine sediment metagenome TaxID=412755 RepID=A0A0F9FI18_9ZZZZ